MNSPKVISNQLTYIQSVAIANDPSRWSREWALSQLEQKKVMTVLDGEITPEPVIQLLIETWSQEIPSHVWQLMGAKDPSFDRPEAAAYLEPLAARVAVATEAYLSTLEHTDPSITRAIVAGEVTPAALLAQPPAEYPETFALFAAIKPVLDEVRLRIPKSFKTSPTLKLGGLPSDGRLHPAMATKNGSLDVWSHGVSSRAVVAEPDLASPEERMAYIEGLTRSLESGEQNSFVVAGNERTWLLTSAHVLFDEQQRLQRASNGDVLTADKAPACLPNGTNKHQLVAQLSAQSPAPIDTAKTVVENQFRMLLGLYTATLGTLAIVAEAGAAVWADSLGNDVLIRGLAHPLTSTGSVAFDLVLGATSLVTVNGVKEFVRGPKWPIEMTPNDKGRRGRKAGRELSRAVTALAVENEVISHEAKRITSLTDIVVNEFGRQCALDDRALDTLHLPADAAQRAMGRRLALGRSPSEGSPQWNTYATLVTKVEIQRVIDGADEHAIPTSPEIAALSAEYRPIGERAQLGSSQSEPVGFVGHVRAALEAGPAEAEKTRCKRPCTTVR